MRTSNPSRGRGALPYLLLLVAVAFLVIANAPSASARRGGRDDCRDSKGSKYDCKKGNSPSPGYSSSGYSPSPGFAAKGYQPSPSPGYSGQISPSPGYYSASGSDDNRKGRKYDDNPKGRKLLLTQVN